MNIGEVKTGIFAIPLRAAQSVAGTTLRLGKVVCIVARIEERVP